MLCTSEIWLKLSKTLSFMKGSSVVNGIEWSKDGYKDLAPL